jgi:DNA invertase Pin-like site-specific DNA recombinase
MEKAFEVEVAGIAALRGGDTGAPVSVAMPGVGMEEPVVGQERWEEIRRLKVAGMTVSRIARASGLDRKTVRRCCGKCAGRRIGFRISSEPSIRSVSL